MLKSIKETQEKAVNEQDEMQNIQDAWDAEEKAIDDAAYNAAMIDNFYGAPKSEIKGMKDTGKLHFRVKAGKYTPGYKKAGAQMSYAD